MSPSAPDIPTIPYHFKQPELLVQALTHRSRGAVNYERLEFLGDSVLNLVVSKRLFDIRPDDHEGSLSRLRSRIVRGESIARMATSLNLGDHLIMGEGELKSGGYLRQSVLADVMEAVLGAVYLDGGFSECERVIMAIFDDEISALPDAESLKDPKTRLQEWLQARGRPIPEYELCKEEGADHAKQFHVRCRISDNGLEKIATGSSRRKAEQRAAKAVLDASQGD